MKMSSKPKQEPQGDLARFKTSGSVVMEIERIKKNNIRRNDKITQLRGEIVTDSTRIKELERLYKTLNEAELQDKIADSWFKRKKLTDEQVLKFLELSEQIGDKIDSVDISAIAGAITGTAVVSKKIKPAPQAVAEPVVIPDEPPELPQIEPQDEV